MPVVENLSMTEKWELLYRLLGVQNFVHALMSQQLQDALLPLKIVCIFFALVFFVTVMYFYVTSSYVSSKYLYTSDFFAKQPYGARDINSRWRDIARQIKQTQDEKEHKFAIVEADDLLYETLENRGFEGETFLELLENAKEKIVPSYGEILSAHGIRDIIVHNPDYKLDIGVGKTVLANYERAIKNI